MAVIFMFKNRIYKLQTLVKGVTHTKISLVLMGNDTWSSGHTVCTVAAIASKLNGHGFKSWH